MSKIKNSLIAFSLLLGLFMFAPTIIDAQKPASQTATTSSVKGSGTSGRITKWVGDTSPSVNVSDSVITESNSGQIGVGTTAPTSKLTVAGTVETTFGGYKFPDSTVQTTAALASISHDATLTGNGTPGSPLGVAPAQTVRSLNGLTDTVTLAAGANIAITSTGNTLTIASTATDPAKNAFQSEVLISISEGENSGVGEISVPANKRLVIEYIAIKAVGDDPFNTLDINAPLAGNNTIFQIMPIPVVGRISAADKQVRIFADGTVSMVATLFAAASNDATVRVTVSGHLVDLQ